MAQLTHVGQGEPGPWAPLVATLMLLLSLVLSLLGIKFWGFRRRLTFDRGISSTTRAAQPQSQSTTTTPPRYAAYESQVNGTDSAVHGVFRQRNTEEFESARPTNSPANKYLTGSVPNLQLATLTPQEYQETASIPELPETVPYRSKEADVEVTRSRRREVHSASYDYYATPPTRQPPAPPVASLAATDPASQLDIPNFDHFAEKYELISAQNGNGNGQPQEARRERPLSYVKYEQVDDVPELLTPDDESVGAAISVAATVHHVPQQEMESPQRTKLHSEPLPKLLQLEHTDSAFVVEIIAGTPESIEQNEPVISPNLFVDLELMPHQQDAEFEMKRSSYEMNEADILDIQPDFAGLQHVSVPAPSSPPGFGKSIDEDWENFEDLDHVTQLPEPNWLVHPNNCVEREQQETLFDQLELMEPEPVPEPEPQPVEPPPYEVGLPMLPDYEDLMQFERLKTQNLPNYADVVGQGKTKYVSSIEDLFGELQEQDREQEHSGAGGSTRQEVQNFDELCEELDIPAARQPPQPAPRSTKPTTLHVRDDAVPLSCYEPEELPSSSSGEEEATAPAQIQPKPAKRQVRFDVDNLQYYQSAELPSSDESEEDELPRPTQRLITLPNNVPRLFGTQVSQEDSDDDEAFGRAINQHRSMTDALRPAARQLDNDCRQTHTEA